jgi:hypothetical protein
VKDERFPWTGVGAGPEPRLPSDFASRAIEKARAICARRRRAKVGAGIGAGLAVILTTLVWMRPARSNQNTDAQNSRTSEFDTATANDESGDVVTVLMPNARQAEQFNTYYGTAAWDSYASWDPDSYDASRTR